MSDFSTGPGIRTGDIEKKVFSWDSWQPTMPDIDFSVFKKQPILAGPQTQEFTPDYKKAEAFVNLLRTKGPRAAYASVGARDIESLFKAAVDFGLLGAGEQEAIWAEFNAPEPTTTGTASNTVTGNMGALGSALAPRQQAPAMAAGTITDAMIARSGGAMNAYDNAWAAGNMAEPQRGHFKTTKDFNEYYRKWRDAH
jgi:hypothetical protein